MAKRVYKERVYPIATQINIQRAVVAQHENALAETQKLLAASKRGPLQFVTATSEQLAEVLLVRERDLAAARDRLAALEAQLEA